MWPIDPNASLTCKHFIVGFERVIGVKLVLTNDGQLHLLLKRARPKGYLPGIYRYITWCLQSLQDNESIEEPVNSNFFTE